MVTRIPAKNAPPETNIASQFPEVDRLIETEDFDRINKAFTAAYEDLEKAGKARGGLGKSRDAKKAMKAIERVMDLLRDLLKLKYQLMEGEGISPQGKK